SDPIAPYCQKCEIGDFVRTLQHAFPESRPNENHQNHEYDGESQEAAHPETSTEAVHERNPEKETRDVQNAQDNERGSLNCSSPQRRFDQTELSAIHLENVPLHPGPLLNWSGPEQPGWPLRCLRLHYRPAGRDENKNTPGRTSLSKATSLLG